MSEISRIIANCSLWELMTLRRMGMEIPMSVKGEEIEDPHIPDRSGNPTASDRSKWWRERNPEKYAAYIETLRLKRLAKKDKAA